MASFEEAIARMLSTDTALTTYVGTRVYDSILPAVDPTTTSLPAITFQVVDRRDEPHFTGYCPETATMVQVDTWCATAASRRTVTAVLRTLMQGWRGAWGGIVIRRALKDSDFDSTESRDDGGPLPAFRNTQRWTVWTRQAPVPV